MRCKISLVSAKNWSKPQHFSWSASRMLASTGVRRLCRPLGHTNTHQTRFSSLTEPNRTVWTLRLTWRGCRRSASLNSTRSSRSQISDGPRSRRTASLWWSYTCQINNTQYLDHTDETNHSTHIAILTSYDDFLTKWNLRENIKEKMSFYYFSDKILPIPLTNRNVFYVK